MDPVAEKLANLKFAYADQDDQALSEIAERVAAVGRRSDLITYSNLVQGLSFHLGTVNRGEPFQIGPGEWSELHRTIIGDFLGRLCAESYARGEFMASALVVSAESRQPSQGFRKFMGQLGILRSARDEEFLTFWSAQVNKAHAWYNAHQW